MNIVTRRGLRRAKAIWSRMNDFCLGIETGYMSQVSSVACAAAKNKDGEVYQAVDYLNIRRILRFLKPGYNEVFYDIGCGKGRVVCCAARWQMKRIVGLELNAGLCSIAQNNVACMRWRRTPVEIRCEDAAIANISDGTIFFMFNPFGTETMRDFLKNVEASLLINPRPITIVYCNPVCSAQMELCKWLVPLGGFKTLSGGKIRFWKGHNVNRL